MSNLLDKASILLTPTAYNDGSMLSIKPENGDGDFTFSRGSAATRVNAQGLVENVQIISSELVSNGDFSQIGTEEVTNGDFATDSDWSFIGTTEISGGIASFPDSTNSFLIQNFVVDLSVKNYKLTYEVVSTNGSNFRLAGGNSAFGTVTLDSATIGTKTAYLTSNGTKQNLQFNNNNFVGSIDNVSVKEVGQDWIFDEWTLYDNAGDLKAKFIGSTSGQYLKQENIYTPNTKIRLQFTISNLTSGQISIISTGVVWSTPTISTNGTFTYDIDTTGTSNGHIYIRAIGGSFNGYIDNISVKEITDDTDLPRIDYTDGCGSWLLEPQSTNTVPYSSDFSQWTWGGDSNANNTTRVDNQSSPDGETNAALFTRNVGTGGWFSPTNLSVVLNQTYTYSLFVKKGTSSTIEFRNVNNSPQSAVVYNIDTDTFTTEQNSTGSSVDYGNGWYRIAMTFEHLNTSTTSAQIRHTLEDGESMYVFGSQFENLSYATSYIPTSGAANTRLQDIATNSGNSTLINSTEGVLYAEIAALSENSANRRFITLNDGTASNGVVLRYETSGIIVARYQIGGIAQCSIAFATTITNFHKIAFKYKENNFALWVDGVEVGTDNSGSVLEANTINNIDFNSGNGAFPFYGEAKALAVYPILTNAELQSLTTI